MEAGLFWALLGALIGLFAGMKRGFNLAGAAIGGALLGPLAFLMFFMSGLVSRSEGRVKCPYCAEFVSPEAIVCKHCRRDIPRADSAPVAQQRTPLPRAVVEQSVPPPKTAKARVDGQSLRCANSDCGRLLWKPTGPCPHCGTVHV